MCFGLTLTEKLLGQVEPDFRARWPRSWDSGRLVLAPQYRVGQDVVRRCVYLMMLHMVENTDVQYLLGSCTYALSRLYRRFGFTLLAKNVPLQGTEKNYTLIHGPILDLVVKLGSSVEYPISEYVEADF
jgi:hypothetical protein